LRRSFSRVFQFFVVGIICFFVAFGLIAYVLFDFWFSFVEQEDDKDRKPQPGQASCTDAVTEGKFFFVFFLYNYYAVIPVMGQHLSM